MNPYKDMYLTLFNQITSTIEQLKQAQQRTEEMAMTHPPKTEDTPIRILPHPARNTKDDPPRK